MNTESEILGFKVTATLGFGARSSIFAVIDSHNNRFALKRVIRNATDDQRFLDQAIVEHEVAKRFCHPNLRRSFKLVRKRRMLRTQQIIVLMELVEGRPLDQFDLDDMAEVVHISKQIALALGEMHAGGYVHCDIKPNNIIYCKDKTIKVIDFGQSCPIGTVKERIQGTPDFIAPEQVHRKQMTPRTDVFNLGATLYWMLTGKHVPTLIGKHSKSQKAGNVIIAPELFLPPREHNDKVPPALSSLVMDCVESEPSRRPASMTVVYERLRVALRQYKRDNNITSESSSSSKRSKETDRESSRSRDRSRRSSSTPRLDYPKDSGPAKAV